MRIKQLAKQLLLFCIVGFIASTLYQISELEVTQTEPEIRREIIASAEPRVLSVIPPRRRRLPIDCRKIIELDQNETALANAYMKLQPAKRIQDAAFAEKAKDCANFRESLRYDSYPVSDEEKDFPLAFSIITYKDADQTERLLRAIYRPQNFYCIHVDKSSSPNLHGAMRAIADCFTNVFIVSKSEDIIYNHVSRLQADLNCMSDLLAISDKWKYFLNLPHQQFPLKTNLEMVKILKIYNGANDIEGISSYNRQMPSRFKFSYKYGNGTFKRMGLKNKTLPYNATMVKGSAYGIFSRAFVHYIIHDQRAKDILDYMRDVKSPDEYYWATLNHNEVLKAPGRFNGNPETKPWMAVYASWGGKDKCHGKYVRGVCVFGVADLNELVSKKEFFANKFYFDYQYFALDCLEEYIFNRTFVNLPFETYYYKHLPFILK